MNTCIPRRGNTIEMSIRVKRRSKIYVHEKCHKFLRYEEEEEEEEKEKKRNNNRLISITFPLKFFVHIR